MTDVLTDHFDALRAEKAELDTLLERGMEFTVAKRSLLRYLGKPDRRFVLYQPFLGTLDRLSDLYISLSFSEDDLKANPLSESKMLIHRNVKKCARIIAVAVLNSKWKIKLLTPWLSNYFLWRLTPEKLFKLTILIMQLSNIGDFTNSIRYLNATPRTTSPNLIEKMEQTT